jgi:hypothetical protein
VTPTLKSQGQARQAETKCAWLQVAGGSQAVTSWCLLVSWCHKEVQRDKLPAQVAKGQCSRVLVDCN